MAARRAVATKSKAGAGGRAGASIALVGLAAAAVAAPAYFMLLVGGMIPTIVAFIVDHSPRHLARTVAATNLAGLVLPALAILSGGSNFAAAFAVLRDPQNWLIMYGAAASGWIINSIMPPLARIIIDMRAEHQHRHLMHRGEALIKEWGEAVSGRFVKPAQPPK